MKRIISTLLIIIACLPAYTQQPTAPNRLRCDFLLNTAMVSHRGFPTRVPLQQAAWAQDSFQFAKIFSSTPVFNWELSGDIKKSTDCRLLVASSLALINNNRGDYWDSKKIVSSRGRAVYAGLPLAPGKLYYWKVQVWDKKGQPSSFSSTSVFYKAAADSSQPFSHHPLTASRQSPVQLVKQEGGKYFLDFGKDGFGQLILHLTSDKNDSIWIEAAEALEAPGRVSITGGNIRYIRLGLYVKKGMHDYTIVWPVNEKRNSRNPILMPAYIGEVFPFRYVTIENFNGVIDERSVQRKMVFYPFDESASYFHSSDSVLNQVWELCKYSMQATSFSGYYVDGDRERLPYEADALINQLSHYAVDAEYSIARRSMAFLLYHPTWLTEWSLQNISLAWYDYLYTGDDAFLRKYYSELQKKILMPLSAGNGLISTTANKQSDDFLTSIHMMKDFDGKHGLKDNVDWPQKGTYIGPEKEYGGETDGFVYTDYNSVINAWYYNSLNVMEKIAASLGKKADAAKYKAKAAQVYQSFQQVFRDRKTGLIRDGDTTDHVSLHANMFALAFGLVPSNDLQAVTKFIRSRQMACSVYGAQFLLDALYDSAQSEYALSLMTSTKQRSWFNMIRVGSTITMEAWDKVYKPNLDLNHAWGAAPANIIVRKLMGIEPLTPGFETFRIKPQLGGLQFAELKTTTIKGEIVISCKNEEGQTKVEVTIPGGSTAMVVLPIAGNKKQLLINGKISRIKLVNGFFTIPAVQSGKHLFILR